MAPVALLSGIALSPESQLRYVRHSRKAVILLRSPSLVHLGVGSTPPPPLLRSRPVATLQPTFNLWQSPATHSSGPLLPHDRLICPAMAACVAGGRVVGFLCSCLWPFGAMYPSGFALSGGATDSSLGCHTPTKCWLGFRISRWGSLLALRPVYMALPLRNSCVVLSYDFVLLAPVSLPCLGRMGCVVGLRASCLRLLVYVVFLSRLG